MSCDAMIAGHPIVNDPIYGPGAAPQSTRTAPIDLDAVARRVTDAMTANDVNSSPRSHGCDSCHSSLTATGIRQPRSVWRDEQCVC